MAKGSRDGSDAVFIVVLFILIYSWVSGTGPLRPLLELGAIILGLLLLWAIGSKTVVYVVEKRGCLGILLIAPASVAFVVWRLLH